MCVAAPMKVVGIDGDSRKEADKFAGDNIQRLVGGRVEIGNGVCH